MGVSKNLRGSDRGLAPGAVVPFGYNGAGLLTEHPVGLVVALGILAIGLEAMPEARWFFVGAVASGVACGFLLWLHHR